VLCRRLASYRLTIGSCHAHVSSDLDFSTDTTNIKGRISVRARPIGFGFEAWVPGPRPCTLVHFPKLWPTFQKTSPAVAGGRLKSLFRGFLLGPSLEMSQMADRVGHPRKLQNIIAKSFIDRSGSGLKYWNHGHAPVPWSTFPELRPTNRKLAPAVRRPALTKYRLLIGPFRALFS
jgi:hypothetical protein